MLSREMVSLWEAWQRGEASDAAMLAGLREVPPSRDVVVDLERAQRCGYPEVVYAQGKTAKTVLEVFAAQQQAGQASFATRVSDDVASTVCATFPAAIHNPLARTVRLGACQTDRPMGRVLVVTAGTTDRAVAEEAVETARWMGCPTDLMMDVGVAGPHRLIERRQELAQADVIVVVAGMEGALPSVVAGWVNVPVIGVPTSVGYGLNLQGGAALLSMLNSCAANVAVVNVDAGFKGGYLAGMIARHGRAEGPTPAAGKAEGPTPAAGRAEGPAPGAE